MCINWNPSLTLTPTYIQAAQKPIFGSLSIFKRGQNWESLMGTHMEVAISDRSLLLRLNRFTKELNRFNGESVHCSDSIGSLMNRFSLYSNRFIYESVQWSDESIHSFCLDFFTFCCSRLLSIRLDRFQLHTCTKNSAKHT